MCRSWEKVGTSRVVPQARPFALRGTRSASGSAEAIAPTERSRGVCHVPVGRMSRTTSCHDSRVWPVRVARVSVYTVATASP